MRIKCNISTPSKRRISFRLLWVLYSKKLQKSMREDLRFLAKRSFRPPSRKSSQLENLERLTLERSVKSLRCVLRAISCRDLRNSFLSRVAHSTFKNISTLAIVRVKALQIQTIAYLGSIQCKSLKREG